MQQELEPELTLRRARPGVRFRAEAAVSEEGAEDQAVELRGVLESLTNRFYRGGWGYGTMLTDRGQVVKITGSLEGHVTGTSLIVRGIYKESQYGLQLDCSSIVVDSVSGELSVIVAWARKYMKELQEEIVRAARTKAPAERWEFLCDPQSLLHCGFDQDTAGKVSRAAKLYLMLIAAKKGLMEKGFTDHEAEAMCAKYGQDVERQLEEDPFGMVVDGVLSFSRIDSVDNGKTMRNDLRRLNAALVQTLVSAQRNGHTAVHPRGAQKEAADMAGVYPESIIRAGLPRSVVQYNGLYQLRRVAYTEADIAAWVHEAMKRA